MQKAAMFIGQRIALDCEKTYGTRQGAMRYGTVTSLVNTQTPGYLEDLPCIRWDDLGLSHACQPCWLAPAREDSSKDNTVCSTTSNPSP
jgi:hypothetical protein